MTNPAHVLARTFFDRAATDVAPDLLGCVVEHETAEGLVAIRLTEVEAYLGQDDPGSHAFRGVTPRTKVMFGPPGHAYVYFSYGMHWCLNVVCDAEGTAAAVLLRAGQVVAGHELATERRRGAPDRDLARGPARLTQALGVDRRQDGADVVGTGALRVRGHGAATSPPDLEPSDRHAVPRAARSRPGPEEIRVSPRTGVGGGGAAQPWRYYLADEPTVSPYRAHQPRRRPSTRAERAG